MFSMIYSTTSPNHVWLNHQCANLPEKFQKGVPWNDAMATELRKTPSDELHFVSIVSL